MQAQGLLFTCTTTYTEKSRRPSEVFFTGSLTVHADWRHARNAGFYKFSSPTFRWRLLTHGSTSFATNLGILRWKWRLGIFRLSLARTALNVVMLNMYTILILDFGHEKLCRRDTELETLLDENARVLEWCATPPRQWKIVSWLGMNMCP